MLSERSASLVYQLLQKTDITVQQLSIDLSLTKRQIVYSLSKINDELETDAVPAIRRDRRGHFLIRDQTRQWLMQQTGEPNEAAPGTLPVGSYYDECSRQSMLMVMLIACAEPTHLNYLKDKLAISRNTLLIDLKRLGSSLNESVTLKHLRNRGYFLMGDEWQILKLLISVISHEQKTANGKSLLNQLNGYPQEKVVHIVSSIESGLKITYSDSAFNYLVQALRFSLSRMKNTEQIETYFHGEVSQTKEFDYLSKILKNQDIELRNENDDLSWLTLLLLSANTLQNDSTQDGVLIHAIEQMIAAFEDRTCVTIRNKKEFIDRLLGHMRPVIFRTRYELPLTGIDFSRIIRSDLQNTLLLQHIKECIRPVEMLIGKRIAVNEMQLISFYFGAELKKYSGSLANKKRAVVVCSNGLVVAKLMFDNLKIIFPELNVVTTASVRQFDMYQADYDLVFTTVPLKTTILQFIIEPVLSVSEQLKLRLYVLQELGIEDIDSNVKDVMKIIQRYSDVLEKSRLQKELTEYFINLPRQTERAECKKDNLPPLSQYIKPQYIQIATEQLSWEEAMRMACQPLIRSRVIESRYVDYLIRQMSDPQNYSYLRGTIVIPHALAEMGALADGFGFLISHEYLHFPGHDRVTIVVPIAIAGPNIHLRAVDQLVDLAGNHQLLRKMQRTGSIHYVHQLLSIL